MTAFVPSTCFPARKPCPVGRRSTSTCHHAAVSMQASNPAPKLTLYGTPLSNYAVRCDYMMRRKGVSRDIFDVALPSDLGGLKSDAFLRLNPLGLMPVLTIDARDGSAPEALFESSVICQYLAETFDHAAPSFIPQTAETRAKARLIAQTLDLYVGPQHAYMHKPIAGVETLEQRARGIDAMRAGFDAVEHALDAHGPYAAGLDISIADCCLWANFPFYDYILPTFFGWHPTEGRPKLKAWHKFMGLESQAARDAYLQIFDGLHIWWENGRWDKIGLEPTTGRPEPML